MSRKIATMSTNKSERWRKVMCASAMLLFVLALAFALHGWFRVNSGEELAGMIDHLVVFETPSALLVLHPATQPVDDLRAVSPFGGRLFVFALIIATIFGIGVAMFPDGWILHLGRMSRWRLLAAVVWSFVLTIGAYSYLNNVVVAERMWGPELVEKARAGRHTLRTEFLRHLGRVTLPQLPETDDDANPLGKSAMQFLNDRPQLATIVQLQPGSRTLDKLWSLLNKSDQALLNECLAEKKLELGARTFAKPANHFLGYAVPGKPLLRSSSGQITIETPTADSIRDRLITALRAAPDDVTNARATLAAQLLKAELDEIDASATVVLARRCNGLIQWSTMFPFFLGTFLIVRRYHDRVLVPPEVLAQYVAQPILAARLPISAIAAHVLRRKNECQGVLANPRHNIVYRFVQAALEGFLTNRNPNEGQQAVDAQKTFFMDRMYSEHAAIRFIAWVIPSIGFVGTVIGIGNALLKANKLVDPTARPADALQSVVAELGVAFDTTFVALLASMVLMLAFYLLQRREEQVILDTAVEASDRLIRRFVRGGLELPSIELAKMVIRKNDDWAWRDAHCKYRATIIEVTGGDPFDGYDEQKPTWLVLRLHDISEDVADDKKLPERGIICEVHLSPATSPIWNTERKSGVTNDGLWEFIDHYFGKDDFLPESAIRAKLSWAKTRNLKEEAEHLESRLKSIIGQPTPQATAPHANA